ncbi:MAG: hypothetical protein V3T17_09880 [Pseudomonadales bacterium]
MYIPTDDNSVRFCPVYATTKVNVGVISQTEYLFTLFGAGGLQHFTSIHDFIAILIAIAALLFYKMITRGKEAFENRQAYGNKIGSLKTTPIIGELAHALAIGECFRWNAIGLIPPATIVETYTP